MESPHVEPTALHQLTDNRMLGNHRVDSGLGRVDHHGQALGLVHPALAIVQRLA